MCCRAFTPSIVLGGLLLLPLTRAETNLNWVARDQHRIALVRPAGASGRTAGFTLIPPETTGIGFTNSIPESRHLTNQILLNGSGVAAGDVDGDGWVDLFLCGFDNDSSFLRNRGGWKFSDGTADSGLALSGLDCTGAAFADLDGDGDLDLVVNTLGQGTHLLINNGRGEFGPVPTVLNPGRGAMSVALADVDGDGRLDLYLTNYRVLALMDMPSTRMTFKRVGNEMVVDSVNGRPATDPEFHGRFRVNSAGGIEENGEPDVLYRNQGENRFMAVEWTKGAFLDETGAALKEPPRDWGLAAMFRDVNGDGRPDLYVCNDFQSPDRLWLNLGEGRFQLAPPLALRRTSLSSMAVDFADVNRDGQDDFLVAEMLTRDHGMRMRWVHETFPHRPVIGLYTDRPQIEQNTLHLNRGDGTWAEVAQLSGLEATEWTWACAFLDVDLDGWEDVLIANGMERAARDLDVAARLRALRAGARLSDAELFKARKFFPRLATPNLAFRNHGDLTFRDMSAAWGFDLAEVSQAIALADLDNDADLDVVVANLNASVAIYRNDVTAPRVAVRLRGRTPNTQGAGARIEVTGGPVFQTQEMIAGGRYLAGDDPVRSFAAGSAESLSVRVRWPDGGVSEVSGVPANSLVEVAESDEGRIPRAASAPVEAATEADRAAIRFEDRTEALNHRHFEEVSDDFARQPLLPRKLSQPGPGVAWCDLDGDGDDDLVVGSGKGGRIALFRNEPSGLALWENAAANKPVSRDVTGLVVWPRENGTQTILAALSNYEDGAALGPAVMELDLAKPTLTQRVSADTSSAGPLALGDINGDGQPDLFVGGAVVPGQWPAAASSRFFRATDGRLVPDAQRSRLLEGVGLVNGAVFTDLDADGDLDLVLACEWSPLRIFRQEPEEFIEITDSLGLSECRGWWTSVTAADLDSDGRMDLVAGNWGRNTPYELYLRRDTPNRVDTLRVYHGDFTGDGIHDILEAHLDPRGDDFLPRRQLQPLLQALPGLVNRYSANAPFGEATALDILEGAKATIAGANFLESAIFLNRGDRLEMRPLPMEAQVAPVFGIAVMDGDGDGDEDLFLAQNFFAVRPHTPRYDGGIGIWLENDGAGSFKSIPSETTGVRIYGEQRGAAVADYDLDGRADLVVAQNGAGTRLFRNAGARAGLRVRLEGPAENPGGIGARIQWSDGPATVRELHAGSGYLSQDSLVQVLARLAGASRLKVHWPGNVVREYEVPADAIAVRLTISGEVQRL
jgi:hypothetical protein